MSARVLVIVSVALLTIAAWSGAARAHAKLVRTSPAPGSTVQTAPKEVRAWFSEELEPRGSTLSVWDRRGTQVDSRTGGVDLNDLDRQSMVARLKPLQPGTYTARWKAISADDLAVTQGTFQFTIAPK